MIILGSYSWNNISFRSSGRPEYQMKSGLVCKTVQTDVRVFLHCQIISLSIVFCMHKYSFIGLIKLTPAPTFSDTAIQQAHDVEITS